MDNKLDVDDPFFFLWLSRRTRPVGLTREGKDGYTESELQAELI